MEPQGEKKLRVGEKYILLKKLGEGAFGIVYQGNYLALTQ
jgi:hypothetical protein